MVAKQDLYTELLKKDNKTITEYLIFWAITIIGFMYVLLIAICVVLYFILVLPILTIFHLITHLFKKGNNDTFSTQ